MSVFSFPVGVTPDMLLRPGSHQEEVQLPPPTKPPARLKHRRARDEGGQFKPDDPATPANEAWEPTPESPAASDADESISEAGKT